MNAQLFEWNDLRYILAVCREGTLSGAARTLEVNHSTVFRRITAIEDNLGVKLFKRLSNGYAMTEAGEAVLVSAERIENEVHSLSRHLIGRDLNLNGTLRVTAPDALAVKVLIPHISTFCHTYPDIRIELSIANQFLDLIQREADVAIRSTMQPPESAIGRRICKLGTTFYATKTYLDKYPNAALEKYSWIMPNGSIEWLAANSWLKKHYPGSPVVFNCDTMLGLCEAAKQHLGVVPLPCFFGDLEKDLQRIMPPVKELTSELWLLIHPDLRRTARVRAFVDFLIGAIENEKNLIEGKTVT